MTGSRSPYLDAAHRRVAYAGLIHRLHRSEGTWCCMELYGVENPSRPLPTSTVVTCLWCWTPLHANRM